MDVLLCYLGDLENMGGPQHIHIPGYVKTFTMSKNIVAKGAAVACIVLWLLVKLLVVAS
jgi:hypothetical protein